MATIAGVKCPCGCLIRLHMDDTHRWWETINPDVLEDIRVTDHFLVGRETFTETTICECGQRYRALDHEPWITPESGEQ